MVPRDLAPGKKRMEVTLRTAYVVAPVWTKNEVEQIRRHKKGRIRSASWSSSAKKDGNLPPTDLDAPKSWNREIIVTTIEGNQKTLVHTTLRQPKTESGWTDILVPRLGLTEAGQKNYGLTEKLA
jgi:hypothetical protein